MEYRNIERNIIGKYNQSTNINTVHKYFNRTKPIEIPIYKNNLPYFINKSELALTFYDGRNIKILPLKIMNIREIVYDYIYENGKKIPMSITYSPLTGSPVIYSGRWGNSELLYNNNMILYDKNDKENLLLQISGEFINGKGVKYKKWQVVISTIESVYNDNVLVLQGGINDEYNYKIDIYRDYRKNEKIKYNIDDYSEKYPQKKIVYAVNRMGKYKRNRFKTAGLIFSRERRGTEFKIGDNRIDVKYNSNANTYLFNKDDLFIIPMYWFAYYSYYKNSDIYKI